MKTFSVWALDDNSKVEKVLQQLLKDDGWLFEMEGEHGLKLDKFFRSRSELIQHLKFIGKDSAKLPLLVLLDGNLGGEPSDTYGGFHAWRSIMDHVNGAHEDHIPATVLYTRDPNILQLAKGMSSKPANPIILPFAERSGQDLTLADARYRFSPILMVALERRRKSLLRQFPLVMREKVAKDLRQGINPTECEICGWALPSLFPRESRSIMQGLADATSQRQSIINALLGDGLNFREALQAFVGFFLEGRDGEILNQEQWQKMQNDFGEKYGWKNRVTTFLNDERLSIDKKPSHWIIRCGESDCTNPETCGAKRTPRTCSPFQGAVDLAAGLVLEADAKWGEVLGASENHRKGSASFKLSHLWILFQTCVSLAREGQLNFTPWKKFLNHLYTGFHSDLDNSDSKTLLGKILCFDAQGPKWTCTQYLDRLGIFPADVELFVNVWTSVGSQGFTLAPSANNLVEYVNIRFENDLFCGSWPQGIHLLCDLGIPPKSNWRIHNQVLPKMNERPVRSGSLSDFVDTICRIYQGQLLIFNVANGMIDNAVSQGPYGPAGDFTVPESLDEIYTNWSKHLKDGHLYNLVSFRGR